ncbi:MAG: SPFH domain-containing protein [Steroidobacteraceae bacterium]
MAIIDRVKWDGSPDILAWKFGSENLSTATQLIVNESQEAFLVKEGVYQGPFLAGRHTLSTANIPLLRGLIAAPFGGDTPFTAEVWYVNKATNLDVRWGTPDPIQLQDPKFQIMCPVRAFGQYGILIEDSKRFLLKLVGTLPKFDSTTVANYMRGVLTTRIKNAVADAIIKNGKSVLEISTELNALSGILKESLQPDLAEYGVKLVQFNIHSINVPEDDPAVQTLKAALAKRTELSLLGISYQQDRSLDILQTAAGNEGTAGGVMGAGLGMGLGVGIGVPLGQGMGQIVPALQPGGGPAGHGPAGGGGGPTPDTGPSLITCDKCSGKMPRGSKFCPHCADPVTACPKCGDDNASEATACRSCGAAMPTGCVKCSATIPANSKFCPECGAGQASACEKCGAMLVKGSKFCGECGTRVES